jgi:hypothetical protein
VAGLRESKRAAKTNDAGSHDEYAVALSIHTPSVGRGVRADFRYSCAGSALPRKETL